MPRGFDSTLYDGSGNDLKLYQGGDWAGIIAKIPYMKGMGIAAVFFSAYDRVNYLSKCCKRIGVCIHGLALVAKSIILVHRRMVLTSAQPLHHIPMGMGVRKYERWKNAKHFYREPAAAEWNPKGEHDTQLWCAPCAKHPALKGPP